MERDLVGAAHGGRSGTRAGRDLVGRFLESIHRRFQEWRAAGVFHEIWRQRAAADDEQVGIDWEWLAADGAMTKAPLGCLKTGPNPTDRAKRGEALGPHGSGRRHRSGLRTTAPTVTTNSEPRRSSRSRSSAPSRPRRRRRGCAWTAPTTCSRCTRSRSRTASRASARAARNSPHASANPTGARGGGSGGGPLGRQPQPRHPHPLVQKGRRTTSPCSNSPAASSCSKAATPPAYRYRP